MINEFSSLLQDYLDDKATLNQLRDWIAAHLGNPPNDVENLMLDVAMAMWEMDDGYGTAANFRATIAELLAETLAPTAGGDA